MSSGGEARIEGLDGLRGYAMLMVIAAHLQLMGAGWWGLQSFFVLSGFLITRVLLNDLDRSTTTGAALKRFYLRRTLRVFPIYYAYLTLLLAAHLLMRVPELEGQLGWAYLYLFNYHVISLDHTDTKLMDHLWSLSVEEQFYFIWPLTAVLLRRSLLPWLLVGVMLAGPFIRYALGSNWPLPVGGPWIENAPNAIYFQTLTHLDAFAAGALLNWLRIRLNPGLVLLLILGTYAFGVVHSGWGLWPLYRGGPYLSLGYPRSMPFDQQWVFGYTLVNLCCLSVIVLILQGGLVRRLCTLGWVSYIGERSYSIYIIHYPILKLMEPLWSACESMLKSPVLGTLLFCVPYLTVVFGCSALIYKHFEMPILRIKERFSSSSVKSPKDKGAVRIQSAE